MIPEQYDMIASGKVIRWKLDVGEYPRLRFICLTALQLNGRPEICSTPYFATEDVRLRMRDRKKKGALFPHEEKVPNRTYKWMRNFVHVLMVGEAWSKTNQKESR